MLIPSGIQTDNGTADLRKLVFDNYRLLQLYSFENRGYQEDANGEDVITKPFPDVDNRFKFSIVSVKKERTSDRKNSFRAKFYLHNPAELYTKPIKYSQQMVKKFRLDSII